MANLLRCVYEDVHECQAGNSPPDTGGVAAASIKCCVASLAPQTGWLVLTKCFKMHFWKRFHSGPPRPLRYKEASRLLLDVASTPPMSGGEWRAPIPSLVLRKPRGRRPRLQGEAQNAMALQRPARFTSDHLGWNRNRRGRKVRSAETFECQSSHTSAYLLGEYSDRCQWRIEGRCSRVIETKDADIVRDSQARFMNRFVSAHRRSVITGEERGHSFAALQNGLRCKVTEVLSFA